MSISDLYLTKVATVFPDATIEEAIEVMRDFGVDDVIVVENKDGLTKPCGILTGHDIVMRAYRLNADIEELTVREVMTHNLVTCKPSFGVFEIIELMQRCSVKRLPVIGEAGELLGIITASDLFSMLGDELGRLSARPKVSPWQSTGLPLV
jgi:CBS domain-containing protein